MKDTFAMVYAEPGNPLLGDLIAHRCVAALPVGGRFRAIDFLLSNLSASGIKDVGVITQRNFQSLDEHIGSGDAWDLARKKGGVALLHPFDQGIGTDLYRGFADALFAKRYYLERQTGRYCLLLNTDVVYRQDYRAMLDFHKKAGADITVLYAKDARLAAVRSEAAVRFKIDPEGWVYRIESADDAGDGACYNLGAMVIDKDLLVRLVEDACAAGRYDLVTDVLEPALARYKVAAFEHEGYAARISSVKTYAAVMQDMLKPEIRQELFFAHGPVHTRIMDAPPVRFASGCTVENSLCGNGCEIRGRVVNSVLFRGVHIDANADVENCIVMQDSRIGAGAHLRNAIIDKNSVVGAGARVVGTPDMITVARKGSIVEGKRS